MGIGSEMRVGACVCYCIFVMAGADVCFYEMFHNIRSETVSEIIDQAPITLPFLSPCSRTVVKRTSRPSDTEESTSI